MNSLSPAGEIADLSARELDVDQSNPRALLHEAKFSRT
jgi:hypothetical protein